MADQSHSVNPGQHCSFLPDLGLCQTKLLTWRLTEQKACFYQFGMFCPWQGGCFILMLTWLCQCRCLSDGSFFASIVTTACCTRKMLFMQTQPKGLIMLFQVSTMGAAHIQLCQCLMALSALTMAFGVSSSKNEGEALSQKQMYNLMGFLIYTCIT